MQPVRQVVHAASDLLRAVQRFGGEILRLSLDDAGELLEIDFEQRHLLADVVVKIARDPRAFRFLRVQQARAEVADAIVTLPQLDLVLEELAPRPGAAGCVE